MYGNRMIVENGCYIFNRSLKKALQQQEVTSIVRMTVRQITAQSSGISKPSTQTSTRKTHGEISLT